jgi:hypothetical protein
MKFFVYNITPESGPTIGLWMRLMVNCGSASAATKLERAKHKILNKNSNKKKEYNG